MEQQIDQIIAIDTVSQIKAQKICQNLINENYHQFFNAIINKIKYFIRQKLSINYSDYQFQECTLKNLIHILNRQINKILKNSHSYQEEIILQMWSIQRLIIYEKNLNYQFTKIMIPSISSLFSLCNQQEIQHLIFQNNKTLQNQDLGLIFTQSLFTSKTSKKIICLIGSQLYFSFHKNIIINLEKLVNILKLIQNQQQAEKIVYTQIKKWIKYQQLFYDFFQKFSQNSELFDKIIEIINSKLFKNIFKLFVKIEQILQIRQPYKNMRLNFQNQIPTNFSLILECKYQKMNKSINILKAQTFQITNFIFSQISDINETRDCEKWDNFISIFNKQIIQKVLFDIFLIGQQNSQFFQHSTSDNLNLISAGFIFLQNILEIDNLKEEVLKIIMAILNEKKFLFFGCICNIKIFQQKYYSPVQSKIIKRQKNKIYFVSQFMKKILPYLNISRPFVINFCSDLSTYFLGEKTYLSQIIEKYQFSSQIQSYLQGQNLNLHLHIISILINDRTSNNDDSSDNEELFEMIKVAQDNFENLETNNKILILRISQSLFKQMLESKFSKILYRVMIKASKMINQPSQIENYMLVFAIKLIIRMSKYETENKNKDLTTIVDQMMNILFQAVIANLKKCNNHQEDLICTALSHLLINQHWNNSKISFNGNFLILQICIQKLNILKNISDHNQQQNMLNTLPKAQLFTLIKDSINALQLQFNEEDQNMQIKISQMRQLIIDFFNCISNYMNFFDAIQINQLLQIIQVLTGLHLQGTCSQALYLIIKNDQTLVNTLVNFLSKCQCITTVYLTSVQNLFISFQGNISTNFIFNVLNKILHFLPQSEQIQLLDSRLLSSILTFMNIIFLYRKNSQFESNQWYSICNILLKVIEMEITQSDITKKRVTQHIKLNDSDVLKVQIRGLQFKYFLFNQNYCRIRNGQNYLYMLNETNFSNLVYQYKLLKKRLSLKDLSMILYSIQNYIRNSDEQIVVEFIYKLGYRLIELKQLNSQMPYFLQQDRFNPYMVIKQNIVYLIKMNENRGKFESVNILIDLLRQINGVKFVGQNARQILRIKNKRQNKELQVVYEQNERYDNRQNKDIQI